jgi:transposase
MSTIENIRTKFEALIPYMDERLRRLWAGSEAVALGDEGIKTVAFATGLSTKTIRSGIQELQVPLAQNAQGIVSTLIERKVRKSGGGRKSLSETDNTLIQDLEQLIAPATRGDPCSPLLWTSKSTSKLAKALEEMGHKVSPRTVAKLLDNLGYSLQSNRKTSEGSSHEDRDAQFQHINEKVKDCQKRNQPVISVDTKKKELIGNYKNAGQEWSRKKEPISVKVHDFPDPEQGKVIPYGVYDLTHNTGWVNVGISHDTAEFAVASIRQWWKTMGKPLYPEAEEILITADCGGSNGYRIRLWKSELQKLATEIGLAIKVSHVPPGTSKWNKIEHRMFCHITENWRGRPLISQEIVVNLISNTTTKAGLTIKASLDKNEYKTGIKISDKDFDNVHLVPENFHGEWNYSILP